MSLYEQILKHREFLEKEFDRQRRVHHFEIIQSLLNEWVFAKMKEEAEEKEYRRTHHPMFCPAPAQEILESEESVKKEKEEEEFQPLFLTLYGGDD